ncbi:sulfatase-like hydrolase/transferase, partial [Rubinisphaera sp.]
MSKILNCVVLVVSLLIPLNSIIAESQPNVVLIFIDDMGWEDFSCFGNRDATTEHIDRMANEGIRFEQFYVNSPICSPSRAAITTGQYPQRWKINSYLASRELNKTRGVANWLD